MNTSRSSFLTATGATTTGAHAQDDGHDGPLLDVTAAQ